MEPVSKELYKKIHTSRWLIYISSLAIGTVLGSSLDFTFPAWSVAAILFISLVLAIIGNTNIREEK